MSKLIGLTEYLNRQEEMKRSTVDVEDIFSRYEKKERPEVVKVKVQKRGN